MKANWLVLLAITCTTVHGTVYAAPPIPPYQQESSTRAPGTISDDPNDAKHSVPSANGRDHGDEKASDEQPGEASDKRHPAGHAGLIRANRPMPMANNRQRSASPDAANFRQPGLGRAGLTQNETVNSALRVRPPSSVRPLAPTPGNARHLGPNPAAIGGSANSDRRNAGTINGTGVNRQH